jgi:ATP:ADP antiporter, AAA family
MARDKGTFSPLRAYFWPVHAYELRKFLPLLAMAFFIGCNYNILRNLKDALLVTAEHSGAEVIPFIKVWGVVPGALILTFIYSRLNNRMVKRDRVFTTMILIFLIFFALFTFCIYPLQHYIHPHKTADLFQAYLPPGFKGLIAMFRYWTFSSFYIMSELWSSTVLSMLFWGFANEVTKLGEAKRFYGLIAIGLNIAAITSGQVSYWLCSSACHTFSLTRNPWHQSVILLTVVILLSGAAILIIFRYLSRSVLSPGQVGHVNRKEKIQMSMRENFAILGRSKYLLSIAIIVLAYNLVINLVEVIWKDQVRQLYPDPNQFNAYMSQITTITGIISFFASLLISGQLIRKFGWTVGALITPLILLLSCFAFFFFFFGHSSMAGILATFGTSPLALVVLFGSFQNCVSRASKFTLFDSTKEMAFIPLSIEDKLKGKAAIDGVGSRLGKSGGSLIHQSLVVIFSSLTTSAPIVAGLLFITIFFWIGAVLSLGKQFNALPTTPGQPQPNEKPLPELAVH